MKINEDYSQNKCYIYYAKAQQKTSISLKYLSNTEVFLFILFDKIFRESGIFLIGTVQIECNQSIQYRQQDDQSQVYHQTSIGSLERAYDD